MKIKELALLIEGFVEGDDSIHITNLSGIESAQPGDLTFAMDEDKLALAELSSSCCVLTTQTIRKSTKPLIRVNNPKLAFLIAYNAFQEKVPLASFIHPTAVIAHTAQLGQNIRIEAYVVIEDNVVIGNHTTIESGCVIKKNCKIGDHCYLHPNGVIYENSILKNKVINFDSIFIIALISLSSDRFSKTNS